MKSAVRLLAVFAIAILAGFASQAQAAPDCGENTGKKATGKPIPIGAVTTMSGIGSFKEADDAVRAYFDCVNANGGIHGRPITYHDEDDQSQLDVAAQAAKKLVGDEGVYAMIGSTSIIECIPNANYYLKENIVEIGEGIPPQCYQSKNIAEVNAGPRASGIAGADYARRVLGAKSVACSIPKFPGSDWSCGGLEEWGKKFGVKVTSIYSDPVSPDINSLVLQVAGDRRRRGDDLRHRRYRRAHRSSAAQQQDGAAKMKWTGADLVLHGAFPRRDRHQILERSLSG